MFKEQPITNQNNKEKKYKIPKKPLIKGRRFYFRSTSYKNIALQDESSIDNLEELTEQKLQEKLDCLKKHGSEELTEDNLIQIFNKIRKNKFGEKNNKKFDDLIDYDSYENKLCLHLLSEIGAKKSIDFAIDFIKNNNDAIMLFHKELMRILKNIDKNYASQKIFESLADKNLQTDNFIIILTILVGAEQTRQKLNELIEQNREQGNNSAINNLEYARSFITPNHDKIAIENLQTFYQEKIKFEEYDVNKKMNKKEVKLLQKLINKDDKILEMGCGTGRLLLEMKKAGYDITGNDYVERHVELVKKQNESADVFQGDWHNNAVKNENFNKIYSLGRNILHDYSLPDQVHLFREAHRMLKPSGQFIFDIPNREKGGYKEMVDEYSKEMQNRGIKNFRFGAIYDSPDEKNFTTRYAYSDNDIKELARLTGFNVKEVKKEGLATGKNDENLYYILEKK